MAQYNRQAAFDEAQATWNVPCRDGTISRIGAAPLSVEHERTRMGLGSDWKAKFIWNFQGELEAACFVRGSEPPKMFQPWAGLGDCAHFMSKCLQAGGLKARTDFVPTLESYLRGLTFTKTLAVKASAERCERIIKTQIGGGPLFKKGDVVLYYDPTGKKIAGYGPIYHHSALYVGYTVGAGGALQGTISCHTRSRFLEPWLIFGATDTDQYTLIHFGEDDPVDPALAAALQGMWEVKWRGQTFYYLFEKNGKVSWGSTPRHAEGTGYWFAAAPSKHVICWTKTGTVEKFTLTSATDQTGEWNDGDTLTAKKKP